MTLFDGADAVVTIADGTGPGAALLLPVTDLRTVSAAIVIAVAQTADEQGLAEQPLTEATAIISSVTRWARTTATPRPNPGNQRVVGLGDGAGPG
jgi:malic enzyme